ncbi:MAG: EF-hand domain-containing protein [Planctomycetes bacterium]|nr:EF-hand domain-containing protein [Planctomycetota bacterium]
MKKPICTLQFCLCVVVLALFSTTAPAAEKQKAASDVQDLVFLADGRPLLIRLHIRVDGKPYLAAWEEFVNYVFDQYDTNKDGVLDKDEAARVPPIQSLIGNIGGNIYFNPGGFAVGAGGMDANRDGKVTREELANYFRRNGGAPFQLTQGGNQANTYSNRVFLDYNGRPPRGNSAEALNKALMKLLDTDKDGKLSRKELAAAPVILLKKDVDDDEIVTSEEILGEAAPNDGNLDFVFTSTAVGGGMPVTDGPLVAITPGEPARTLARKLLERYGAKDGKKTGKLSRKDLGLDEESFHQLDVDEDGLLDAEELARFARRPADLELSVVLGAGQGVKISPVKGKKGQGFRLTENKDGSVGLGVGNTHVDLKIDGGGARSGIMVAPPINRNSFYKMQFSAADQDNNGYLDMNEARRSPFFGALFKAMDADGDGKLYLKEVLAYFEKQKALQDRAQAACVTVSIADQGKGLFDILDKDGDGRLNVRELRDAVKLIDKLDQNGDGMLEPSEIPRRYTVSARRGPAGGGGDGFGGVVRFVSYGGGMRRPVAERTAGPLWFRKMDRNRDGDVSRREFLGSDELFKKIDLDGDGLISREEAEKADELFRKQNQRK